MRYWKKRSRLHIEIIYHCKRHEYCFTIENVSRTFFSQLNKYTFVQMMLITGVLPFLPGSFHKYYALYKFYEFLPHLDPGNYKFTFCFNIFEIIYVLAMIPKMNLQSRSNFVFQKKHQLYVEHVFIKISFSVDIIR